MIRKKVLIVGGGFGGVKAAIELSENPRLDVTLISDRPTFRFYPALYRTATGGVSSEASIPLERIFDNKPVSLRIEHAAQLDSPKRHLITKEGHTYHYDFLILSLGVVTNYFGIKGLKEYSYGIKSLEQAVKLKHHLHAQLIDERSPDLNYVIVGGGATGVELAGSLGEYLRRIMRNHGIEHRAIHIDLVEAGPRLLAKMPLNYSQRIATHLHQLGVRLYLDQTVQGESADSLMVNSKPITSHTVVWTAGVTNNPFFAKNGFSITDHGKVVVDQYLQAAPDIFVLGDNANTPYSGTAQTALYDAKFVANNIARHVVGKQPLSYVPKKPIYVTPAGPHWAAVAWGRVQLYGIGGWVLHQAAEFRGFHDLLKFLPASEQWVKEFAEEDDCPVCATASNY
jgi:NADH dehydrogenase